MLSIIFVIGLGVNLLTISNTRANLQDEATCYSSTKDCAWWSSCWNTFKCGTCKEIDTRRREDSNVCTVG